MEAKKQHRLALSYMAWENLFRDKKSPVLVFTSLFCGLSLFLVVTGILHSLNPENFVREWGDSDFTVTYSLFEEKELIPEKMAAEISQMKGIRDLRLTYTASPEVFAEVVYDDAVFGDYIESLNGKSGIDFSVDGKREDYQQNFYSGVYGIDSAYLEETSQPIDAAAFENGEVLLLSEIKDSNGKQLIQPGQEITMITPGGQHTFYIAQGFLDADFQAGRGNIRGTAPNLYISQNALKKLFPHCRISRIAFDADKKREEHILRELESIAAQPGLTIISRCEKKKEMAGYLMTANILGTGLSLVLLFVGVMNYISTMAVRVSTRRHELAILECVGMAKRQVKKMLMLEGFFYWLLSLCLVATAGTAIYLSLYAIFRNVASYAVFSFPISPFVFITGTVLLVCLIVPLWIYKMNIHKSIVERLRTAG